MIHSSHVYKFRPVYLAKNDEVTTVNDCANQKYDGAIILQNIFSQVLKRLRILRAFCILHWSIPKYSLGGAVKKSTVSDSIFSLQNTYDVRDFLKPKQAAKAIYEISGAKEASGVINLCSRKLTSVAREVKYFFALESTKIKENLLAGGNS